MIQKKILLVATEYGAGMRAFFTTIANTLTKDESFEIYILTVSQNVKDINADFLSRAKVVDDVKYPSNKILRFIYKFYPFKIIHHFKEMVATIDFDFIHFLTVDFSLFPWLYISRSWDDRFVYTVHDLHQHEYNFPLPKKLLFSWFFWGGNKMHKYIKNLNTSSKSQYLELKNMDPQKNIFLTHAPSVITKPIIEGHSHVRELNGINNYILFFGSVDVYKGVDILIDAYDKSKIKNRYPLVIAGKGIKYDNLPPNVIRINRFIDDSEVRCLFERSVFTVYPYISATQSAIMSLSFFFKKKAILSNLPFFLDNKTDDTIFFENGNADDLRGKMDSMSIEDAKSISYESLYSDRILLEDLKKMYQL